MGSEMCRNCYTSGHFREVDSVKKEWLCTKCGKRYVCLKDGAGSRFYPADANGRALAASQISTRSFDPCSGLIFAADGRPASSAAPTSTSRTTTIEEPETDLETELRDVIEDELENLEADRELVDFADEQSVERWNKHLAARLNARVAEVMAH